MATSPYDARHEEMVRRIVAARKRLGLRQEDLASCLRLPQSVISRLEAGQRKISAVELRDLSELLDSSMDALVPSKRWRPR